MITEEIQNRDGRVEPLKWGILGAARIARKAVAGAIRAQGGAIAAVGASSMERAQKFARQFDIPLAVEGYGGVVEDPEVEAVYIPLVNGLHFRWALECALAGKHCLCEKPLVLSADEARQLRVSFGQAGRRLMEAFMWRHHPWVEWAESVIRRGEIGNLRRIHAVFSYNLDRPGDYRWSDEMGGGALLDIGCYCVNAVRLFFADQPQSVSACSVPVQPGSCADRSTVGWLDFGRQRLGVFECSFSSAYAQNLTITGTEGILSVNRPFPTKGTTPAAWLHIGNKSTEHHFEASNAYEKMIAHFTRAVGDPSFALHPAEDGLSQAIVMETLAQSTARQGQPQMVLAV